MAGLPGGPVEMGGRVTSRASGDGWQGYQAGQWRWVAGLPGGPVEMGGRVTRGASGDV